MSTPFKVFCAEEIKSLIKLVPSELELPEEKQSPLLNDTYVNELKEMIKKGERLNFKLIQELSGKLEELGERLPQGAESKEVVQEVADLRNHADSLIYLLLDVFDLLDYLKDLKGDYDQKWVESVDQTVSLALDMLRKFGMDELPAHGLIFDPYTMEGIGTIPLSEGTSGSNQFEVIKVVQRGFRHSFNQQLIRKAKVITLL
ncbi:MAG: nucleotide exchange factor GrpE [Candidatus Cohnella colombiensis]|uniref:Nucleotide exchange factor GrpE n=1 Tax=Candidatus Cohnella colombiensis TaxID=3121368 RepID=A0AA95JBJ0_9BACL|nr:MAG: nucleotide exchange factor GrpE [Cohnella sp.]